MGSVVGRIAFPFVGLYGATKFALEGLTESYRDELAPFGVPTFLPPKIHAKDLQG